ncbi:MAG: 30S ribosomal protein S12 methylthiotransferase RimO [Spirochaetales bacterium]|jgi:ribosomal protein S12 methylthiotransferase|nr:30S ribosomal protein S12 methylthiotransferase RimO [Spirochaetales bacterium]
MSARTFYIENLGCAKNQVDGEGMVCVLEDSGWRLVDQAEEAALIIVNTCGFIGAAKKEALDTLLNFRKLYPAKKIIAAGCLAERYGQQLFSSLVEADGIFGNRDIRRIAELARSLDSGRTVLLPENYGGPPARRKTFSRRGSVYIKAAEGCDNRCSFCAIPLIRGGLKSRPAEEITAEIKSFLSRGAAEFNIVAQDLGAWTGRDDSGGLFDLARAILEIPGDYWIRFLYIHPEHFPRNILRLCEEDARLLPYFDLPFQHASFPILKAMGRRADSEENLRLIGDIRQAAPDAVIRSTFLLGFPGETEKDFQALLDFQEKAAFDWLGCFTYSPEEDTPAQALHRKKDLRVPAKTAKERKKIVEQRQTAITEKRFDRFTGRTAELLVEEAVEGEELCLARAWFQAPEVDGLTVLHAEEGEKPPPGTRLRAKLVRRNGFDMEAVM